MSDTPLTDAEILDIRRCYQGTPVIAVCNLALRANAYQRAAEAMAQSLREVSERAGITLAQWHKLKDMQ